MHFYASFFKLTSLAKLLQTCVFRRAPSSVCLQSSSFKRACLAACLQGYVFPRASSVQLYVSFFKHATLCELLQACVFSRASLCELLWASWYKLPQTCVSTQASSSIWLYANFFTCTSLRKLSQLGDPPPYFPQDILGSIPNFPTGNLLMESGVSKFSSCPFENFENISLNELK